MEVDLEEILTAPANGYRSQVCIAGAGIAGLVLATALAEQGIDVHLLEAGGKTLEDRSQHLYNAAMAGEHYSGASDGRFRVFGGSSTRWGGQLLPYSAEIFQPSSGLPSTAWPIGEKEITRYYPRIEAVMGTDALPYTAALYSALGADEPTAMAQHEAIQLRFSKWAPFSKRNLAQTAGKAAAASGNITVFYHANVTSINTNTSRADSFTVRNYAGRSFRFDAAHLVLAVGTIETSRLLLASPDLNANGQAGLCLHDHLSYEAATLTGVARVAMLRWFAPMLSRGTLHTAKLEASPALRERLQLLAVMAHMVIAEPEDSGAGVVRALLRSAQQRESLADLFANFTRLPGASREVAQLIWSAQVRKRRQVSARAAVALRIDCEQRPRPENRVSVNPRNPDALGVPRAVINWRVGDEEAASIRGFARFLQQELPRMGVDGIGWRAELSGDGPLTAVTDTYHMMGGALMGANPAGSVVDPELRVHGVPNLSIASCATFPAGGSSNPTFTLMALCFRLAERLRRELT